MKFIANNVNGNYLRELLPGSETEVDSVLAAIAYGSLPNNDQESLIGNCIEHRRRLDLWMRYDHTVPVSPQMLKFILKNFDKNVFCQLIPDQLHSKVIWWKGYGAYIGSANLTERAWITNIEAGLFLSEEDLHAGGMIVELDDFFERLQEIEESFPLSQSVIEEMEDLQKERAGLASLGKNKRSIPEWGGISFVAKQRSADRKKTNFEREWKDTLTVLDNIATQLSTSRPVWVASDTPINWQVDQFLHAYYYNKVATGQNFPFEDYHRNNRSDPQTALTTAISWWSLTEIPPSHEDETFEISAPYIQTHLRSDVIAGLSIDKFTRTCEYTHATKDHISKVSLAMLGENATVSMSLNERIPKFAQWLWNQTNQQGWGVARLLEFILYSGADDELWERLYLAGRTTEYQLPHYGLNSLAEVVGWARPEVAPPRNGRTSKALRALGYDVRIY